jgi:hypothetical protein
MDDDSGAIEYLHCATPDERLKAAEFMRQIAYGYDACSAIFQRVLEFAEF